MIAIVSPLERWLSGRKRQIANLLYGSKVRTEGSNPSLSVLLESKTDFNSLVCVRAGRETFASSGFRRYLPLKAVIIPCFKTGERDS
jgi:hypothetical protein